MCVVFGYDAESAILSSTEAKNVAMGERWFDGDIVCCGICGVRLFRIPSNIHPG